jgi:hypothetical protein
MVKLKNKNQFHKLFQIKQITIKRLRIKSDKEKISIKKRMREKNNKKKIKIKIGIKIKLNQILRNEILKKIITIKRLRTKFDIINKKQDIFFQLLKNVFHPKKKNFPEN